MLFKNITMIDENYQEQKNMYILTEGNKITYIGKEMPKDYKGEIYDGENKVAVPGYFNAHCHVPMTLMRGYGEGLPLDRWLFEKIFPFEDLMSFDDMYWGSVLGIAEMIASGCASFSDMYMQSPAIVKAVEESGIKANISRSCSAFSDDVHYKDLLAYEEMNYLYDYMKSADNDRIIADTSIHAEYTTKPTLVREVAEYTKERGLMLQVHISETEKEHRECKERYNGMTPTQWMKSLGIFDNKVTAAHCIYCEDEDLEIFKESGTSVVHNPTSNLKLGSGILNLTKMINKGINVCIGTDGASSNNNLNMHEEINLASILQKGVNRNSEMYSPSEMFKIACKNGAISQGRMDCGAIKVGNRADIVIYDLDKPHLYPVYDVLATIMYSAAASDICLNMVDGKVLYKDGIYTTIDIEKAKFNANRIRDEKLSALAKVGK